MVKQEREFHDKWIVFQAVSDLDAIIVRFRELGYPEWAQKLADTQTDFLVFLREEAGNRQC